MRDGRRQKTKRIWETYYITCPIIVLNAKLVIVAIEMPFALVFVSKTYMPFR